MQPWVITLTDNIERHTPRGEVIEKPLCSRPITAAIDVDDYLRHLCSTGIANSLERIGHQLRKLGPLRRHIKRPAHFTVVPEQPLRDLIAELHVIGHGSGRIQHRKSVAGIVSKLGVELSETKSCPRGRLRLLPRIRPRIREMKIEHEFEPGHFWLHAILCRLLRYLSDGDFRLIHGPYFQFHHRRRR